MPAQLGVLEERDVDEAVALTGAEVDELLRARGLQDARGRARVHLEAALEIGDATPRRPDHRVEAAGGDHVGVSAARDGDVVTGLAREPRHVPADEAVAACDQDAGHAAPRRSRYQPTV